MKNNKLIVYLTPPNNSRKYTSRFLIWLTFLYYWGTFRPVYWTYQGALVRVYTDGESSWGVEARSPIPGRVWGWWFYLSRPRLFWFHLRANFKKKRR